MKMSYAFRIVGMKDGKRRFIDAAAALSAYASCHPSCEPQAESYLSSFMFGDDFREYLSVNGTTRGFTGLCWSPIFWFDLDRADLAIALADARKLVDQLRELGGQEIVLFFSGKRGFHVGLPIDETPSHEFHSTVKTVANDIASQAGVIIDPAIYSKVQPFRAPNSRHPATGLYKSWIAVDRLAMLTTDEILSQAKQPIPFDWRPAPKPTPPEIRKLWDEATQKNLTTVIGSRVDAPLSGVQAVSQSPTLNRRTLEFFRHGANEGERAKRLFSSAANLSEFGCPQELAHALLTEPALDSGLSPSETRRQIDCGLNGGSHD